MYVYQRNVDPFSMIELKQNETAQTALNFGENMKEFNEFLENNNTCCNESVITGPLVI